MTMRAVLPSVEFIDKTIIVDKEALDLICTHKWTVCIQETDNIYIILTPAQLIYAKVISKEKMQKLIELLLEEKTKALSNRAKVAKPQN